MHAELAVHVGATTISVAHWGRLLDGELFATSRTIEWAVLMKHSFGFNARTCPRCERKMHVLATITQPSTIRRILEHLGLRAGERVPEGARVPPHERVDIRESSKITYPQSSKITYPQGFLFARPERGFRTTSIFPPH
ncbi:hypothetical protein ACMHYB_30145 [Sorangium sp. So ce1128]